MEGLDLLFWSLLSAEIIQRNLSEIVDEATNAWQL
jgi:hypothetical protein